MGAVAGKHFDTRVLFETSIAQKRIHGPNFAKLKSGWCRCVGSLDEMEIMSFICGLFSELGPHRRAELTRGCFHTLIQLLYNPIN